MKKPGFLVCLFALSLFLLPAHSHARSLALGDWFYLNPRPTGAGLGKILFVGPLQGWVVDEGGRVLRTSDGGATWQSTDVAPGIAYETIVSLAIGMSFVSASTGWVQGTEGGFDTPAGAGLFKTNDGGLTWTRQNLPRGLFGVGVEFVDASNGWVSVADGPFPTVTGLILHTTDGGTTWAVQDSAGTGHVVLGFSFTDVDTGWALVDSLDTVGELVPPSEILKTVDGGLNWGVVATDTSVGALTMIQFVDTRHGWAVGDSAAVLLTNDGGATWTPPPTAPPILSSSSIEGLFFLDANTGWIASSLPDTNAAMLLNTTDGGTTWNVQLSGLEDPIISIQFRDANNGWASGEGGVLLQTTDGGATWTDRRTLFTSAELTAVHALGDGTNIWIVGSFGAVFHSDNGGHRWLSQSSGVLDNLNDVFFVDASTGFACGGGPSGGFILETTDGGATWGPTTTDPTPDVNALDFPVASTGYAVGFGGTMLKTLNGGANWSVLPSVGSTLNDVQFLDAQTGYVAGAGGTVLRTNDGGTTWLDRSPSTTETLNGIFFAGVNTGVAVGDTGTVFVTADGGVTWAPTFSAGGRPLSGVAFADALDGYAVGWDGLILHTVDGGTTWIREGAGTFSRLLDVSVSGPSTAFVVGDRGVVLVSRDITVAVAITGFEASYVEGGVRLRWSVGLDSGLEGFNVYRAGKGDPRAGAEHVGFERLNDSLLPGGGGREFLDGGVVPGRSYRYRLGAVDRDGETFSRTVSVTIPALSVELLQNTPNPFNPSTRISFSLPRRARVELAVYDGMGRRVRILLDEIRSAGPHTVAWDGRDGEGKRVASGVYYYRLTAEKTTLSKKLVLLK